MATDAMMNPAGTSDASQDGGATGTIQSMNRGASEMAHAAGHFVSRTIYTTSYAVSYGVVFPAMVIARAVPKDNALVHGLVDGAHDASERIFGWGQSGWDGGHEEMAGPESHDQEGEADGGGKHEPAAEAGGYRRRNRRHRGGQDSSR